MIPSFIHQLVILVCAASLAQVAAWFAGFPSIVFYLVAGILLGPVSGLLSPDDLFGELLKPFVALGVAFVLFEGGLSLNLREVKAVGGIVLRLVTIGAFVTWFGVATTAFLFLDMSLSVALVFGAILMVTGPTVVTPLLHTLCPKAPLGSILRWEGIYR